MFGLSGNIPWEYIKINALVQRSSACLWPSMYPKFDFLQLKQIGICHQFMMDARVVLLISHPSAV